MCCTDLYIVLLFSHFSASERHMILQGKKKGYDYQLEWVWGEVWCSGDMEDRGTGSSVTWLWFMLDKYHQIDLLTAWYLLNTVFSPRWPGLNKKDSRHTFLEEQLWPLVEHYMDNLFIRYSVCDQLSQFNVWCKTVQSLTFRQNRRKKSFFATDESRRDVSQYLTQ